MASPTLLIRRLKVEGELCCDLSFEQGVNVIQGQRHAADPRTSNACGKTTLVELIRCGLGRRYSGYADFPELTRIREKVDRLWLEVEVNGSILLIERSLRNLTGLMSIRWEPYQPNIEKSNADRVTPAELSPIMLDRLGIPEVSVTTKDGSMETLTFQLLQRAFILHQEDSFLDILDKVQPDIRRTQVIGLLSGITSVAAFNLEPKVGEVQQQISAIENRIREVEGFLAEHGVASVLEAAKAVRQAREALAGARATQLAMQRQIIDAQEQQEQHSRGKVEALRAALLEAQKRRQNFEKGVMGLRDQEADLTELAGSLTLDRKKLRRLRASSDILSSVEFKICPRCMQQVTREMQQREDHGRCSLCARPISHTSDAIPRAVPSDDDLAQQETEAASLLADVRSRLVAEKKALAQILEEEHSLSTQLDNETTAYVSPAVDRLVGQADVIAKLAADLAKAQALQEQAVALERIKQALLPMKEKHTKLSGQLRTARGASSQRLLALRDELMRVLQAFEWQDLQSCDIDPRTLMPFVNGTPHTAWGTGLKGVLAAAYHFSLLALARSVPTYMPTLLVVDSPAVGDLNERNHTALLRYIGSLEYPTTEKDQGTGPEPWQVILTTRRMVPELTPLTRATIWHPDQMLLRPSKDGGTS
jgi:flagellar biosynthesis chaperone FliJ